MALKKIAEIGGQIEKILIACIFLSVIFPLLITGYEDFFGIFTIVSQVGLLVLYALMAEDKRYIVLLLLFIAGILSYFIAEKLGWVIYIVLNSLGYIVFGVIVLILAVRISTKLKSFEMLDILLGILLIFHIAIPFIDKDDITMLGPIDLITFYTASLCFTSATIIYNDNLWYRYSADARNLIKFIAIVALVVLMQASLRFI